MTGQFVGPYRVLATLGSGGMGDVFLAEDTRLGRRVALKKPSEAWLALPSARARLQREASAAAVLTHPHIAGIYDVLDDGTAPYIVMEYVEGESLATILRTGRLPSERVVAIGIQLADALAAAHAKGIVHRDLKPGNVCVTPDGQAKVLDFGLASARMPAGSGLDGAAERLTVPGQFLGTPGYASPEQLAGTAGSPSDDLYSLGVLLFELVTGRRPFEADNALDLAVATMTRTAPTAASLEPSVPPALSALLARALARHPHDRVPSAAAFGAELRDIADTLAGSPTRPLPTVKRRRRDRLIMAAAASLLVLSSVAGGVWLTHTAAPVEATGVPVIAVLPFTYDHPEDQAVASGLRDVLIADLARHPGINVLSRAATAEPRGEREDRPKWARDLGATYLVDATVQRRGGQLQVIWYLIRGDSDHHVGSGRYSAQAEDLFDLQERLAEGVRSAHVLRAAAGPATAPGTAVTRDLQSFGYFSQAGDFLERPDIAGHVDRAIQLLQAALDRDRQFALAWARLGEAYWAQYEITRDPKWTEEATAAITEALALEPDQPLVRVSLARVYFGTGRTEPALEELRRAIALQPDSDDAHRLLGQVLQRAGRTEEAEAEYRRAIELRPNYWRNHSMLGAFYFGASRYAEALGAFTRVTTLQPDNAYGFHNAATMYYHMGDHASALAFYQKAIAVAPMAQSHSGAGTIYYHQGQYAAAAEAFERAIALSPHNGLLHGNLGDALMRVDRSEEARKAYMEAVRLDHQRLTVNPHDATVLARVAVNEAKLGRKSDAIRHATQAIELQGGDAEVLYRSAVVRALTGDESGALTALEQSLRRGYSGTIAKSDHDLLSIRATDRFKQLMAAY